MICILFFKPLFLFCKYFISLHIVCESPIKTKWFILLVFSHVVLMLMLIMLIIQPFPLFLHCSIISWMIPFLLFAPKLDLWKNWASDSTQTINSDLSYCCSWLFIMMRTMTVRMMMKMMMTRFEWWTYWQAAVLTVWKKLADSHRQFLNSIHTSMAAIVIGAVLFTFTWANGTLCKNFHSEKEICW